jgi:hypothetical protein
MEGQRLLKKNTTGVKIVRLSWNDRVFQKNITSVNIVKTESSTEKT